MTVKLHLVMAVRPVEGGLMLRQSPLRNATTPANYGVVMNYTAAMMLLYG